MITVGIPTLDREEVLLGTVCSLLLQTGLIREIILADQSGQHESATETKLGEWQRTNEIRWLRFRPPSIARAMNLILRESRASLVLFVDDDVIPDAQLVEAHVAAHADGEDIWAVAGQVLQPGETSGPSQQRWKTEGFYSGLDFPFWSNERGFVSNVMAGNLSVKREAILRIGGFDENFRGAAYRFETEFARRVLAHGGRIVFEPKASIRHLRAERGGTRSKGSHLGSASPIHGMGDYYFAMRQGWSWESVGYMARRPLREVCTRFHARRPWLIPVKLVGELRAFCWAFQLAQQEPLLIPQSPLPEFVEFRSEFPQVDTQ